MQTPLSSLDARPLFRKAVWRGMRSPTIWQVLRSPAAWQALRNPIMRGVIVSRLRPRFSMLEPPKSTAWQLVRSPWTWRALRNPAIRGFVLFQMRPELNLPKPRIWQAQRSGPAMLFSQLGSRTPFRQRPRMPLWQVLMSPLTWRAVRVPALRTLLLSQTSVGRGLAGPTIDTSADRFRSLGRRWRRRVAETPSVPAVIVAAAGGALLAFFFDPDMGRRRRKMALDRAGGLTRHSLRRLGRGARAMFAALGGLGARLTHPRTHRVVPLDDVTLVQKIESEIFRDPHIPKGNINIDAEHGVVTLRGQLDGEPQIRQIETRVRRVEGVREVRSYLHLPGTPAPNKREALEAGTLEHPVMGR